MYNIGFGIMAHHSRKEYVPLLKKTLQTDIISWDNGDLGLVQAHVQAWEMSDLSKEYFFWIQDDVILTKDFLGKAEYHVRNCVKRYGRIAMHLYLRNTRSRHVLRKVEAAKDGKKDHVVLPNVYSGNSIGLPSEHIKPMLEHFKAMQVPSGDRRINSYLRDYGIPVYFPLPNLVEHRELDSLHCGNVSSHEYRKSIWFE